MPFGNGNRLNNSRPGTGRVRGNVPRGGKGRMGGNHPGAGPSGQCVCPECGEKIPHQAGVPCYSLICPKCSSPLVRG